MNKIFSFSVSLLGSSSFALASIPFGIGSAKAQEAQTTKGTAADLGVMSISLKDAIQPNFGFQGALQGAGTPNQAGIGGFLPLAIGDNSVFFLDAQANANFADFNEYSSIINTKVAGTTISTSTRLGYRFLNSDRSWMFGVNAGYDSRPMATGGTDNGVNVTNSRSVFFQQVALNLEAVSNKWFTSAYLLYPIGEYGYNKDPAVINSVYTADSVMTAGVDVGYNLTPNLKASVGYYYSEGDAVAANGNSVKGRLEYNIANGLTSGINIAYDPAYSQGYSSGDFYKTLNLSADLKWRFGSNGYGAPSIRKQQPVVMPVIQALSATPANRDVRVHDYSLECLINLCENDVPKENLKQLFGGQDPAGPGQDPAKENLKQLFGGQDPAGPGQDPAKENLKQLFSKQLFGGQDPAGPGQDPANYFNKINIQLFINAVCDARCQRNQYYYQYLIKNILN